MCERRRLAEVRGEFVVFDGKVDSKQLGKRLGYGDGCNCNGTSWGVNHRVFRWNGTRSRKRSQRARFNCEVQRREKFRSEKECIKARNGQRPGLPETLLALM